MLNKMAISKLWSSDFVEKNKRGGGLGASNFIDPLKRTLELLIFVKMSPFGTF